MKIYDFFKLENNYNKSYEKIISQKKVTYLKSMVDGGRQNNSGSSFSALLSPSRQASNPL